MLGYIEQHKLDLPPMRSEIKLGMCHLYNYILKKNSRTYVIIHLGQNKMTILSEIGKGSYARVVKIRSDGEKAVEKALKIQKPACVWEWYISKEIQHRLRDSEKVNS